MLNPQAKIFLFFSPDFPFSAPMNHLSLLCWLLSSLLFYVPAEAQSHFADQKIGLYLSSSSFQVADELDLEVSQFLTQGTEDRSWVGQPKRELMIRLGDLLCTQLQALSGANTVYFLNGDLERGRAFRDAYLGERDLMRPAPALADLDQVLVLSQFALDTRRHRSVYIRSNRMITEYIPVKRIELQVSAFDPAQGGSPTLTRVCYDDLNSTKPAWHFDFYREASELGKYLSRVFSQWWLQAAEGAESGCETE
jgi:hypothetical protein